MSDDAVYRALARRAMSAPAPVVRGKILALDPGPVRSALVSLDGDEVRWTQIAPNADIRNELRATVGEVLVIEQIESFGMAVGREVFETVYWAGRFAEAWEDKEPKYQPCLAHRLPRRAVKLHLCGTSRAKDGNIRQALIDRYGGKEAAIGRKAQPGPLYGIKADLWAALALGVVWQDGVRA